MATQFSEGAIRIIEGLGGAAVAVYHDRVALRALCRPHLFSAERGRVMPRFCPPRREADLLYYSDEAKRGYMVPRLRDVCAERLPGFRWQYIVRRTRFLPSPRIVKHAQH